MIVEMDAQMRNYFRHAFIARGYKTWTCPWPEIANSIFTAVHPELILLDWDGRDARALELLDTWKKTDPETRVIIESDTADAPRMEMAMDHGADAFVVKSLSLVTLFHLIENEMGGKRHTAQWATSNEQ